jgi:hypothetical protein
MTTDTTAPLREFMQVVREKVVELTHEVRSMKADNERMAAELVEVRAAVAEHRSAPDGETLRRMVSESVDVAVRAIELPEGPAGPKGEDGRDGADGKDGQDGKDGLDGKDGESVDPKTLAEMVRAAVAEIPAPKDGDPGQDGKDADPEAIAEMVRAAVAEIPAPKDGKDGEPGRDGADGISSEEEIARLAEEHVRTAQAKLMREWYQGVYERGTVYRMGQGVTWDGILWVANEDTKSTPGSDGTWTLAVKRGRDGRDRT